jgi:hypothetical protein
MKDRRKGRKGGRDVSKSPSLLEAYLSMEVSHITKNRSGETNDMMK